VSARTSIRKVRDAYRKGPAKSLILLVAKSRKVTSPQSPAKPRKAQCFQACKAPQSSQRKVHPYGGRPCVPPPLGSGRPLWCFGGTGKAEFKGGPVRRVQATSIPYRSISAGRL
jgi:hypothetical protein